MPRVLRILFIASMILSWTVLLPGCGDKSTTSTAATGDGRIYLYNASENAGRHKADVSVTYFNPVTSEQVEMWVLPGEKKDISGIMPKGTQVTLTLRGKAYVYAHQMDQRIEITVAGTSPSASTPTTGTTSDIRSTTISSGALSRMPFSLASKAQEKGRSGLPAKHTKNTKNIPISSPSFAYFACFAVRYTCVFRFKFGRVFPQEESNHGAYSTAVDGDFTGDLSGLDRPFFGAASGGSHRNGDPHQRQIGMAGR